MTTLVALATKDAIVLGCDSLSTKTHDLINPISLLRYFDPEDNFNLKKDTHGNPILKDFWADIWSQRQDIPHSHMTHTDKLFSLSPFKMGAMITGLSSLGKRTIRSLLGEFHQDKIQTKHKKGEKPEVKEVAELLKSFISNHYDNEYDPEQKFGRPYLEIMLCGYDENEDETGYDPHIIRVKFPESSCKEVFKDDNKFGVAFGGQTKEIQRIVHGTDTENLFRINDRHYELIREYHRKIIEKLKRKHLDIALPEPTDAQLEKMGMNMAKDRWRLIGFNADWGDFSDQNAIACVDFFVKIMINSQQFSDEMPTVGGQVHIAIITKKKGYKPISPEEYIHEGRTVPKE